MFSVLFNLVIVQIISTGNCVSTVILTQEEKVSGREMHGNESGKSSFHSFPTPTYIGCFSAWNKRYTQLEPADEQSQFNPSNGLFSCAQKCLEKDSCLLFIRGIECECAGVIPEDVDRSHIEDSYCNYPCPDQLTSRGNSVKAYACGGNVAYSVYRLSTATHCYFNSVIPQIPLEKQPMDSLIKANMNYDLTIRCGECKLANNHCTPEEISPYFDYFPLNNAQDCVDFCATDIHYVTWDSYGGGQSTMVRYATDYAILTWRLFSAVDEELPICFCGNDDVKSQFYEAEGHCKVNCPGNDMCGGLEGSVVFGSVYCIENGNEHCLVTKPTTTPTTTTTTTTTTRPTEPKTTKSPWPTTYHTTQKLTTSKGSTFQTTTATASSTVSTTVSSTVSTSTTTTPNQNNCKKKCRGTDRQGNKWVACAGKVEQKQCSELIPHSEGTAFWKCEENSEFEAQAPNVSQCKSKWVLEKESELGRVVDIGQAIDLTSSLSHGCNISESESEKYYGHEIANLATLMNRTLCKARRFDVTPTEVDFELLVRKAVDLNACLINSPEPWGDLTLVDKSLLSTQLMEATEDVLFHLTEFVMPNSSFSREFVPISQFKALAKAFDKLKDKETYDFPPASLSDPYRESCIKLPVGWSSLLPENKVEIAVISIATESVAKVMGGTGIYVVNEEKNKIINGRMISLSVTSSPNDISSNFKGEFHGVRSKSLNFPDKGVEITFRHIVEAWGDEAYDIGRKLHKGEKPKAAMGSARCMFWDTAKHMWSGRGCQLVKTSRLETICECSHLTSFAILMDVHRYIGKQLGLKILTLILCPLSEIALFFTILILSVTRNCAYKIRSTICKHLSFCLFLGNGMILVVLDREYFHMTERVCMGAAMTTHYVFLCAFMWMLFEGVQLYRMVVHVFDSGKSYMRHYGTIAYGSPLIIIAVTAAVGYAKGDSPYGGDAYCWLVGKYIWSFMVPAAVVITVNLIILFIALKTAYQLQHEGQRERKISPVFILEKIRSYRVYFKGCFSLTVILGITWVVGFFTLMEGSSKIIAAYLFTILNASQGFFIFLFTCRTYVTKFHLFSGRKLSSYLPSLLNSSSSRSSMVLQKPRINSKGKFDLENDSKY